MVNNFTKTLTLTSSHKEKNKIIAPKPSRKTSTNAAKGWTGELTGQKTTKDQAQPKNERSHKRTNVSANSVINKILGKLMNE